MKPMPGSILYPTAYRLNGFVRWILWFEGEDVRDGVITGQPGRIAVFASREAAEAHAEAAGWSIADEEAALPLDLDLLTRWIRQPSAQQLDVELALNSWNLFSDIANAVEPDWAHHYLKPGPRATADTYDKLFRGNNLRAVTPPGRTFVPVWSRRELRHLITVLDGGLALLRVATTQSESP